MLCTRSSFVNSGRTNCGTPPLKLNMPRYTVLLLRCCLIPRVVLESDRVGVLLLLVVLIGVLGSLTNLLELKRFGVVVLLLVLLLLVIDGEDASALVDVAEVAETGCC